MKSRIPTEVSYKVELSCLALLLQSFDQLFKLHEVTALNQLVHEGVSVWKYHLHQVWKLGLLYEVNTDLISTDLLNNPPRRVGVCLDEPAVVH